MHTLARRETLQQEHCSLILILRHQQNDSETAKENRWSEQHRDGVSDRQRYDVACKTTARFRQELRKSVVKVARSTVNVKDGPFHIMCSCWQSGPSDRKEQNQCRGRIRTNSNPRQKASPLALLWQMNHLKVCVRMSSLGQRHPAQPSL